MKKFAEFLRMSYRVGPTLRHNSSIHLYPFPFKNPVASTPSPFKPYAFKLWTPGNEIRRLRPDGSIIFALALGKNKSVARESQTGHRSKMPSTRALELGIIGRD